ncbi:MAG: hypothetical protein AB1941_13780 [Gemmatimonadota bacterium]
MKASRTFLLLLSAAIAGACGRAPELVAPSETAVRSGTVQATSGADSLVVAEQRGVYTFGSGN